MQRILGIFKRNSDKFSRRRVRKEPDEEPHLSPLTAAPSAYREFQQSQHPAKPKMDNTPGTPHAQRMSKFNRDLKVAFDHLTSEDRQAFESQAAAKRDEMAALSDKEAVRAR